MNSNWIIDISSKNQPDIKHIHLNSGNLEANPKINLIEKRAFLDTLFYMDDGEIFIESLGNTKVEIERGGRKRLLKPNHPTRILPQDVIHIGASEYHIDNIHRIKNLTSPMPSQFGQMANKAILTCAATMMMAAIPACHPTEHSDATSTTSDSVAINKHDESVKPVDKSETEDNQNTEIIQVDAKNAINKHDESVKPVDNSESEGHQNTKTIHADKNDKQPDSWLTGHLCRSSSNSILGEDCDNKESRVAANPNTENTNESKCDDGQLLCLANNRYQCENHRWKLIEECKKPATCKENRIYQEKIEKVVVTSTICDNVEPCEDGQYACYGGNIKCEQSPGFNCHIDDEMYKCEDHQWKFVKKCPENQECTLDNKLEAKCLDYPRVVGKPYFGDDCKKGQIKCDSENAIMFCHNGLWRYKEICKEPDVCKSVSDKVAVCVPPTVLGIKSQEQE